MSSSRGPDVAPGKYLLVVTLGAYACGVADVSAGAITAGDELMAGAMDGKLAKRLTRSRSAASRFGVRRLGTPSAL